MLNTETLFRIGLALKGLDSLLEAAGGVLLLSPFALSRLVRYIVLHELYFIWRHPFAAKLANSAAEATVQTHYGAAAYLILHGLAKLVFIIAVFRRRRWGYIGILAILVIFSALEFYRAASQPSWLAALFGVFDVLLALIIANEYRLKKSEVH